MGYIRVVVVLATMLATIGTPPVASAELPTSPSGEVLVVTVNAQQRSYDEARMRALTEGLVNRTPMLPDVILVQEIIPSSLYPMRDQLNALVGSGTYVVYGKTTEVKVKVLLNTKTMNYTGYRTWVDACTDERTYQMVLANEIPSGRSVAVAGVHFAPSFNTGGSDACKLQNAQEARRRMAQYTDSGIVGDFNKRATMAYYECNPTEDFDIAPIQPWYAAMTGYSTVDDRMYHDTVRLAHYGVDMAEQWSFESAEKQSLCDGATDYRRSRLDYIFASQQMTPITAGTDAGWTSATNNGTPCTPLPGCHYSDHRFLWSHLALAGVRPDTTPPSAPANLVATAGDAQVALDWAQNHHAEGVVKYNVYRDGAEVGETASSSYTDTGVTNDTTYAYTVTATDSAGNEGPATAVSATPRAAADTTAPAPPTALGAKAGDGKVDLTWTASTSTDVASYTVHRDGLALPSQSSDVTTFTDSGLNNGTAYTYTVTATDGAGNVSGPSNTVSATPTASPPATDPTTMHVGDLDAATTSMKNGWVATVTITVHDNNERAVAGATVSYTWSGGRAKTCTTDTTGLCTVKSGTLKTASVTLRVENIATTGLTYAPEANHDSDGDSSGGTSITVTRP